MKSDLDLLWDSFNFYTAEVAKVEKLHIRDLAQFSRVEYEREKLKQKCLTNILSLMHLYQKQNICLSQIIDYSQDLDDIPQEYQVDYHLLQSLQEITNNLIEDIKKTKLEIESY